MQNKKHSKYQGLPVLSSPSLAPKRGKSGLGSRWQREGAKKEPKKKKKKEKNDDPQLIVAVQLSEVFCFFPFFFCGGRAGGPMVGIRGFPPRTLLLRAVHFKG